jgi:hypothetical protein
LFPAQKDERVKLLIFIALNLGLRRERNGKQWKISVPKIGTIPGSIAAERRIHARFEDDRIDAEWFILSPELRAFMYEDEDRSRKITAAEEFYFEWLQAELAIQRENPMNEFAETRTMLKKLAIAHGADSPIGHACHNLLEATENYAKTEDTEQRRQLAASIERQKARLNELVSQSH